MIDRENLRKQIKANPQQFFSHLSQEEEEMLRQVANEEGYEVKTGDMMVYKNDSVQSSLVLRKRDS